MAVEKFMGKLPTLRLTFDGIVGKGHSGVFLMPVGKVSPDQMSFLDINVLIQERNDLSVQVVKRDLPGRTI